MTIQVLSQEFSTSKQALQDALNSAPGKVWLHEPSVFHPSGPHDFPASHMTAGQSFPVVMDHPKRRRFAKITRKADSTFKVE